MTSRVYVFRTHRDLNILNLPLYMFYLSTDRLYDPCIPQDFALNGKFTVTFSELAKLISPIEAEVRETYWPNKINIFDNILANNPNKSIALGANHDSQVDFFKSYYNDNVFVVGSNFDDDETYELVLTNIVQSHLYRQNTGLLPITDHDQEIRKLHPTHLVSVYKKIFDDMGLVPKSFNSNGDYVIPVKDFFNLEKFSNHMSNAGMSLKQPAIDYYNAWQNTLTDWSKL